MHIEKHSYMDHTQIHITFKSPEEYTEIRENIDERVEYERALVSNILGSVLPVGIHVEILGEEVACIVVNDPGDTHTVIMMDRLALVIDAIDEQGDL